MTRPTPRVPTDERRRWLFNVRTKPAEFAAIYQAAYQQQRARGSKRVNASQWARDVLLREAKRQPRGK